MGLELKFPFFDNPSMGELQLDITLRIKTREALGFFLSNFFCLSMFLFFFPSTLMTAE